MKVLLVTFEYPPYSGGIATYALTVAEGLARLGCDVHVLAPAYPGSEALDAGLASTTVRMPVGHGTKELVRFVPGLLRLRAELARFRPDVALLASDLAHGVGAVASSGRGVPFVPVVHGSEIAKHFPARTAKQRVQAVWLRRAYRTAAGVICVSGYVKDLMVRAGFDPDRLAVVHNGVEDRLVEAPNDPAREAQLRERHGIGNRRVMLTFARLTPRKGQDLMIRALGAVRVRHPDVCYVVAGTGDDESRLRALAVREGAEGSVVFAGRVAEEDKAALLDLCDVYVLPSREEDQRVEGLGIALLEAAARARPLVAGRHGGVPEVVEHGSNGYLVDPADLEELASRVTGLLDDPARARAMGASGRAMVRERFLASRMAEEYRARLAAAAATKR
jgi:phosphatidylinositol alpha-1,6-mannosyltransferase